jgi:hypothetical protein
MKYLCLVYYNETHQVELDDAHCMHYAGGLVERGLMLAGNALQPVATATTVRLRDGQVQVTDGPFAETREQLAGFYLIDAQHLDQAIEIAAGIPPARVGSIEIRPIRELQP